MAKLWHLDQPEGLQKRYNFIFAKTAQGGTKNDSYKRNRKITTDRLCADHENLISNLKNEDLEV